MVQFSVSPLDIMIPAEVWERYGTEACCRALKRCPAFPYQHLPREEDRSPPKTPLPSLHATTNQADPSKTSPPSSLPQRTPLHCCHRTRQRPLPDRADAMGTRTPREVPTGITGAQEVTREYAERKYPERGARAGISTGVLKEVFPHKVLLPATNGW